MKYGVKENISYKFQKILSNSKIALIEDCGTLSADRMRWPTTFVDED
jgi:hypothetical protein